jgi:hypothetical protein
VAQDPQIMSESLCSRREWNSRRPEVGPGRLSSGGVRVNRSKPLGECTSEETSA